jgi:hypothetical protein
MKSNKTTIFGLILSALVAIQPIAEGTGYHLDSASLIKVLFAASLAVFGYLAKDYDTTGKP